MNISATGIDLIKFYEGFEKEAYPDSGGIWTIGYGTIRYPNGNKVKVGEICTQEDAETYLRHDTLKATNAVINLIGDVKLMQNQFDALVSFQYNTGGLPGSTLLKKLLIDPDDETIYKYDESALVDSCEFLRWCRVKGKIIQGLINRRIKEADLYAGKI
jgi:lysozyme